MSSEIKNSQKLQPVQFVIEHEIIELHAKEYELIKAIREKYRYGEVTIITRDGLPFRLIKTTLFDDLKPGS